MPSTFSKIHLPRWTGEVRFALEATVHSILAVDHTFEDSFGFLMDLIAITLFAAAFLYGTGWPLGRVDADVT